MFRREDIVSVDVQEYVRREQSRFFRSEAYDPNEAASQIVLEALLVGVSDVRIIRDSGWIAVMSETDWLVDLGGEVFRQFVPLRQADQNAVTAEILLVVFSDNVVTAKDGEVAVIKGDSLGPFVELVPKRGRMVAFNVDTTS